MKETGQVAYEAYWQACHAVKWISWTDLPEGDKDAWRIAAHEAIRQGWVEAQRPDPYQQELPYDRFGPVSPILPVPVNEPEDGAERPPPRQWKFRIG